MTCPICNHTSRLITACCNVTRIPDNALHRQLDAAMLEDETIRLTGYDANATARNFHGLDMRDELPGADEARKYAEEHGR